MMIREITKVLNKLIKGEKGQVLPIVLIFLVLGSLIIAPLLSFMVTGLKAGGVHEVKAKELYAADAGVEDALWKIKNEDPNVEWGWSYNIWDYDYYDQSYTYNISTVNDEDVEVTIDPVWILDGMGDECLGENLPNGAQMPHQELMIVGDFVSIGTYQISLAYEGGGNKKVQKIGVWLPNSWEYLDDTSNLGFNPDQFDRRGGTAYVWDYGLPGLNFKDLPPASEVEKAITFQFTPSTIPEGVFCWIRMNDTDIALSWDVDTLIFKITSNAGNTTVEAYTPVNEFRQMGAAVSGDYLAIGNSLMARSSSSIVYRDVLLTDSSTTASSIPPDAQIKSAYLYWSGWYESTYQTRVPNADESNTGLYTVTPLWSKVDETSPNDSDYITGVDNPGGRATFGYNAFSVPTGATISNLTVYFRIRDVSFGTNKGAGCIKVGGTYYTGTMTESPSNWSTYNYVWTTNPNTNAAWTVDDINGTGTNPLQAFGVNSNDFNPDVMFSMIYAEVKYVVPDTTCTFSIDGTQVYFDGDGNPQQGATELIADTAQVIDISAQYNPIQEHGYSYSCKKDVTELIIAFAEDDDGELGDDGDESNDYYHPGNATYTVGGVDATYTEHDEWAYAGWSLVIIYASIATEGHQLYLYDTFSYCPGNTNIDFDYDGQPGGTIGGFLVPEPVPAEVDAAKMTAFVGEGDIWYTGDYLRFNGTKLWDGINCSSNSEGSPNNVWNGQSIGMSAEGIDVDTFQVTWASGLLTPGDTSAQIDIYTNVDIWNLVYIIISFRSQVSTGGTMIYIIR